MALPAIIDAASFNSLPDLIKSEYKQDGESYRLDVTPVRGFGLEDVSGLKSALEKERAAARDAQSQLKAFDGLDVKAAREALKTIQEQSGKPGVEELAQQIAKTQIEQMASKFNEEKQGLETNLNSIRTQLQDKLVKSAALEALQQHGGNAKLLLPHLESAVRMRQDDSGKFIAEVIDPATGHARVGDSQGNPMTIPQLVESYKANPDFAAAFAGTGATGSGSTGASGFSKAPGVTGKKTISASDTKGMAANLDKIASGEIVVTD